MVKMANHMICVFTTILKKELNFSWSLVYNGALCFSGKNKNKEKQKKTEVRAPSSTSMAQFTTMAAISPIKCLEKV